MKAQKLILAILMIVTGTFASADQGYRIIKNTTVQALAAVVQTTPIVLTGTQVLKIEATDFTMNNDITLRDSSTLIINNSVFNHIHNYSFQYRLRAYNYAKVVITNSTVSSSKWLNWQFFDSSSLQMTGVNNPESYVWHGFQNSASAIVKTASKFQGTLNHSTRLYIENTPMTFVETVFPLNATVDEAFPAKVGTTQYIFPNKLDYGLKTKLTLKNTGSTYSKWGITYVPTDKVVLRNTSKLTVTFSMPATYTGQRVEFSDLRPATYADQTWNTGGATLRLIGTSVTCWSPIVSGPNTLVINDSKLADNAYSFGTAQIYMYRTSLTLVKANDQVRMYLVDSSVTGDVIATKDSIIELQRTTVTGLLVEKDNGQIVILP